MVDDETDKINNQQPSHHHLTINQPSTISNLSPDFMSSSENRLDNKREEDGLDGPS